MSASPANPLVSPSHRTLRLRKAGEIDERLIVAQCRQFVAGLCVCEDKCVSVRGDCMEVVSQQRSEMRDARLNEGKVCPGEPRIADIAIEDPDIVSLAEQALRELDGR